MIDQAKRTWWPFEAISEANRDAEHKAGIDFLMRATQVGFRAYMEGGDFGARSGEGRECRIIWRGKQRRELLLIESEQCVHKEMFIAAEEGAALAQAATVGLAFLKYGKEASQVVMLNQQAGAGH